ncbi:hypothetical protein RSOLAG22IIIB_07693 [Rhizoctonia solani]|uniref:Uncharacterized protein n=1 Tax=Rhizoctonia solani TaxID=456999 RepID=A0A0K6FPV8_9AGAM|nr:hypothetical protein RSOLAG22IIIB_07693 [Rhizoctonia solani]
MPGFVIFREDACLSSTKYTLPLPPPSVYRHLGASLLMGDLNCPMMINPDVAGVGRKVRVALYIQTSLAALSCIFQPSLLLPHSLVLSFTSITLLATAFTQIKTREMSVLDGAVVKWLTFPNVLFAICQSGVLLLNWEYPQKMRHCFLRIGSILLASASFVLWIEWRSVVCFGTFYFGKDKNGVECAPEWAFSEAVCSKAETISWRGLYAAMILPVACIFVELNRTFCLLRSATHDIILDPENPKQGTCADCGTREPAQFEIANPPSGFTRLFTGKRPSLSRIYSVPKWGPRLGRVFLIIAGAAAIGCIGIAESVVVEYAAPPMVYSWSYGQVTVLATAIVQAIVAIWQLDIVAKLMERMERKFMRRCNSGQYAQMDSEAFVSTTS